METLLDTICQCEAIDKQKHIINEHLEDILIHTLQPAFKRHTQLHPTLSRKPKTKYSTEDEFHDNQLWKENNTVDLLFWTVENITTDSLTKYLHLVTAPVLIVLDDYDIDYKTKGVKMVHCMMKKLDPEHISQCGLDNVFIESLFKCLLYLSDKDRDLPLLQVAYPCLLDLIATKRDDQTRTLLYERVLKEGVMRGFFFAGDKIDFLPILLRCVPVLYDELGILGVQYLNALVPPLCNAISVTSERLKEINILSITSLKTVIKKCWPRIPYYNGIIMKAIARCWLYYYSKNDDEMSSLIKELYVLFEAACDGKERADKEALIAFRGDIFNPLFV